MSMQDSLKKQSFVYLVDCNVTNINLALYVWLCGSHDGVIHASRIVMFDYRMEKLGKCM
jgi:hypothetical protein